MNELEGETSDEEFDSSEGFRHHGRDATIFLIDASEPMFTNSVEDEDCPFLQAIRCAHNTLSNKMFASEQDTTGIILFGTTKKSSDEDKYGSYTNTMVLQDLQLPNRASIEQLEIIMNDHVKVDQFKAAASQVHLADSFWLCSAIFAKQKAKQDYKRIFLFTNDDQPHAVTSDLFKQAEGRIRDLHDMRVSISLLPIGGDFEINKCYKELLVEDIENTRSNNVTIDDLLSDTRRKSYKKRILAKVTFQLGPEVKFGVELYNLVRHAAPPRKVTTDRRTSEPVRSVTTKFNADTGEALLSSELTKFTTVCGESIRVEPEEIKSIKTKFPIGLILLGFKPIDKVKMHLSYTPASFLYPCEDLVKGSRLLFGALLDRCQAREVAPICYFKRTAVSKPVIVALLPSHSNGDDTSALCGFHLIYLPFMNDLRKIDKDQLTSKKDPQSDSGEALKADADQIAAAKNVVKKLKGIYVPEMFEDPALRSLWKAIESVAFSRPHMEPVDDSTQPPPEMAERIGTVAAKFNELVCPVGYQAVSACSKAPGPENLAEVTEAAHEGRLNQMTVDKLKTFLMAKGMTRLSGKKKAELIELVKEKLEL